MGITILPSWPHPCRLGSGSRFSSEGTSVKKPSIGLDPGNAEPIAMSTIADALDAANECEVDAAFVPIENSIEGTVSATSITSSSTPSCSFS